MQAGKNRHEHICESLELFGREVLPEFKDRDDAQVKAKRHRLARHRRGDGPQSAAPAALPDGYSFPAIPRRWADENGSDEMKAWLERFATARAAGEQDRSLGILG